MIYQWGEYNSIPQAVRDIVASKIALMDQYVLMQTGQQEYTALVYNPLNNQCVQYRFYRNDGFGAWFVEATEGADWYFQIGNEYYTYTNMGYGAQLPLPVTDNMVAWSTTILSVTLMFAILFKGVLFSCLKKRNTGF